VAQRQYLDHSAFGPFVRPDSRLLILGSFPSPKSREQAFFYGHPQNRFWRVLAALSHEPVPETREEKERFLEKKQIALYDVIESCSIVGSSDSSIRDVEANDLRPILEGAPIRKIYTNGKTADRLYRLYTLPVTGIPAVCLPSTSPANAAWSLERLVEAWKVILGE
jgi:hypoxanthine-DNA glycosylase